MQLLVHRKVISQSISLSHVLALPVEDRLRLVEEIWDSIAAVPEAVTLTDAQRKELDARLEAPPPPPGSRLALG